ncbi:MAG: hypothetical protein WC254_06635 [Candidatus Woesearchaeota archaeon]|jgi:hypothetical protein
MRLYNKPGVVKITKNILKGVLFLVLLIVATTTAYAVEWTSINELRDTGVDHDLTYAYGYTDGYDAKMANKASTPNSITQKFKVVSDQDPDYLGAELAFLNKGDYTSGYSAGYKDASNKNERAVGEDFLYTYGAIKADSVASGLGTTIFSKWNINEIDTSQGVDNLAYEIGYTDASKGNAKDPVKIFSDLSKDNANEVREVYEWLRENKGAYTKKYKEGYEAYKSGTVSTVSTLTKTTQLQSSEHISQQYGVEQKQAAYTSGYNVGYADAKANQASNPQAVLNYDWTLNARYTSKGEADNRNWYTLPEGITQADVENAQADKSSYLKGYQEGYDMALKEDEPEDTELSDEEYVYQIGFEVGSADKDAGIGSNPYTYSWKTHRYVTKTEELDYSKMIRYNRASFIKGYKDGYSVG